MIQPDPKENSSNKCIYSKRNCNGNSVPIRHKLNLYSNRHVLSLFINGFNRYICLSLLAGLEVLVPPPSVVGLFCSNQDLSQRSKKLYPRKSLSKFQRQGLAGLYSPLAQPKAQAGLITQRTQRQSSHRERIGISLYFS